MEKETMKCPYCGEEILQTAKKCKHCGEWLNQEEATEEVSYNVASTNPKRSVPWWTILKGVGGLLLVGLLFLGKNAGQIGRLVGKSSFYSNRQANVKVTDSDIVGKWKYEYTSETDDFEEDSFIKKITEQCESDDEYLTDYTEVDKSTRTYTIEVEDGDYENEFYFSVTEIYKGTWELENSNTLILKDEEYNSDIVYKGARNENNPIADVGYIQKLSQLMDYFDKESKQSVLKRRVQNIVKYTYNEMTVKEESDDNDSDDSGLTLIRIK